MREVEFGLRKPSYIAGRDVLGKSGVRAMLVAVLLLTLNAPAFAASVGEIVARFPAKDAAETHTLAADLLKLGPAGVKEVCGMLVELGKGDDSKARFALHNMALQAMRPGAEDERAMLEGSVIEQLSITPPPELKMFLMEQLKYAGKNASVAPLSVFLADEQLCEPATQTLLTIHTPEAAAAFAKALPDSKGKNTITLVRALGVMREKSAARAILPHADSSDALLRQTAWYALANIGEPSATDALAKAAESKGGYERSLGTRSYLLLAQRLAEAGDKDACAKVCRHLMSSRSGSVFTAALNTLAGGIGAAALPDVLAAVDSKDLAVRDAALQLLGGIDGADVTSQLVAKLKTAAPETRATIIRTLGRRGDKTVASALVAALKDDEKSVRIVAISALPAILGGDAISPLLGVMNGDQTDEMNAAKDALMTLKADGLATALGAAVAKASPAAKAALIEVLGARGATEQVAVVLEAAAGNDPNVRMAAFRALATMAERANAPKLIEMLMANADAGERAELAKAVIAACRKGEGTGAAPSAPVIAALANAKVETRAELLKILARLGDEPAVQFVAAVAKGDATMREVGIRALAEWCNAGAAPALLDVARETRDPVHRVLALRGYVRVVGLPNTRTPEQNAAMLKDAMSAAQSTNDKKLILGGLSSVRCADAAVLSGSYLDDAGLKSDAAATVISIICPPEKGGRALQGASMTELLAKAAAAVSSPALRAKAVEYLPAAARPALPAEANLALNKPVKTNVGQEGGHAPGKAVDGDTDRNAAWFGKSWPCWLEVDLQKREKIEAVQVFFYYDGRYYQYTVEASTDQKEYKKVVDMSTTTTPATAEGLLSKCLRVNN